MGGISVGGTLAIASLRGGVSVHELGSMSLERVPAAAIHYSTAADILSGVDLPIR
ncbi:UNVERIFIED_CONTAM: hypothetical protein FKN15_005467 [Acipenser sinensis]